jgi:ubiquinone biosynthesis protein
VLDLMLGLIERQPQAVVDVLLDWTGDEHSVNPAQLEAGIEAFVDPYHGTPLAQLNLSQMPGARAIIYLKIPKKTALALWQMLLMRSADRHLGRCQHWPCRQRVARRYWRPGPS